MDTPIPPPGTNVPEFTVSEISGAVKRTLETAFARVRVRGEITEVRAYASGHVYFALKDEDSKLRAVAWKGQVPRLGLRPEDGLEVIATGKMSSYPGRSDYQLIVDRLEYAGAGAMLARIEKLRLRLAARPFPDAAARQGRWFRPGVTPTPPWPPRPGTRRCS